MILLRKIFGKISPEIKEERRFVIMKKSAISFVPQKMIDGDRHP